MQYILPDFLPVEAKVYLVVMVIAKLMLIVFIIRWQRDYEKSCDLQLKILRRRNKWKNT